MGLGKAILGELEALVSQSKYLVCSPFENKVRPFDLDKPTVLLIHGLFAGNFSTRGLANYLSNKGYNAIPIGYSHRKNLEVVESEIVSELDRICYALGDYYEASRNISLVGHSQGGLLSIGVAQRKAWIRKAISLGAPYHGIKHMGKIGLEQIDPQGYYVQKIQKRGFPETVEFISVYGSHDFIVSREAAWLPEELPNVRNVVAKNVGHWKLVECYDLVSKLLK